MTTALLSSTYFGPVQWYQKLRRYDVCRVERCESFCKQTYRNRCLIATTGGVQVLTVPVEHGESTLMRDIRISDHGHWRHLHWQALCSAYGDSPFFMYYEDDLRPFFEKRWEFLFDFNMDITLKLCALLDIEPTIVPTDTWTPPDEDPDDFRDVIKPKHAPHDTTFEPRRYYQVYEQKQGFLPNLSILDLLFNMGNEAILYL